MAERRTDGRQCRGQIKEDLKEIQFKKKKTINPYYERYTAIQKFFKQPIEFLGKNNLS